MVLVYIHGASATSESFTHIKENIDEDHILVDYSSANGFYNNLENMKTQLKDHDDLFFVAHSLGGIYALHLANHYPEKTLGGVTLSTPYGGSREADFARYFIPFSRLMKDIGPMSEPMYTAKHFAAPPNWTQVVTTEGQSPWINDPNDGVVTLKSMRSRTDFEVVELPINHYEVVISNKTVDIIKQRIQKCKISV